MRGMKRIARRLWDVLKYFRTPLAIYIASRLIVLAVVALVNANGFGEARLDRWDARSYLSIATQGYQFRETFTGEGSFIAFMPLFPLLIRAIHIVTSLPIEIVGYAIACLAGAGAVCLLYSYLRSFDYSHGVALGAVSLLCFFPSAVFLGAIYTESLFLLFAIGTLYALRKKYYALATGLTALSLVTRMTGIVLVPILAYYLWHHKKSIVYVMLSLAVAAIPMLLFLAFQWDNFGTPFAFLKAQGANWHHHAVWPWMGAWAIIHNAFTDHSTLRGMWWTDATMLGIMIGTLAVSWRRAPGILYAFGLGAFLLAISQSYILGTPRYLMMVLPFYVFWAQLGERHRALGTIVLVVSSGWMVFNTILFSLSKSFY